MEKKITKCSLNWRKDLGMCQAPLSSQSASHCTVNCTVDQLVYRLNFGTDVGTGQTHHNVITMALFPHSDT